MIENKEFGRIVAIRSQDFVSIELKDAMGRLKRVNPNSFEIRA